MEPYSQLIAALEAFIDVYDGGMRLRGAKTALLIQQASVEGKGITVSELARHTGAPLENVRRHMAKNVELGTLRYENDPDDERVARIFAANTDEQAEKAARLLDLLKASIC